MLHWHCQVDSEEALSGIGLQEAGRDRKPIPDVVLPLPG